MSALTKRFSVLSLLLAALLFGAGPLLAQEGPRAERASAQTASAQDASAQETAPGFDLREAETYLDALFAAQMRARHIPGACLALVKDGRVVLAKGYGLADVGANVPVDPGKTLFRAGSVSKLFVAMAVMQLVEQGKLSLSADVGTYLEDFAPARGGFSRPITLLDLLRHTPGFEDRNIGLLARPGSAVPPLAKVLADNRPARVFEPGTVPAYSNYGMALAGLVVERVSGLPFDRYVKERILDPLGMERSSFTQPLPDPLAADAARSYAFDGQYAAQPQPVVAFAPAGALCATAKDMAAFTAAVLGEGAYGGQTVLGRESAAALTARGFGLDPRVSGVCRGFYEWLLPGRRIVLHEGDLQGASAILALSPKDGLGFYAAFNSSAAAPARREILQAFLDRFFPVAAQLPQTGQAAASPALSKDLGGWYASSRAGFTGPDTLIGLLGQVRVNILPDGALELVPGLDGARRVFGPAGTDLYRDRDGGAPLAVARDAKGQVVGLAENDAPVIEWLKIPSATAALPFHRLVAGFCLLVYLSVVIVWPVIFFTRLGQTPSRGFVPSAPAWTAMALSWSSLGICAAMAWLLADGRMAYPISGATLAALMLPYVAALCAVGVAGFWLASFSEIVAPLRRPRWGFWGRLHYTLVAGAALGTLWQLWRLNLLKFPF